MQTTLSAQNAHATWVSGFISSSENFCLLCKISSWNIALAGVLPRRKVKWRLYLDLVAWPHFRQRPSLETLVKGLLLVKHFPLQEHLIRIGLGIWLFQCSSSFSWFCGILRRSSHLNISELTAMFQRSKLCMDWWTLKIKIQYFPIICSQQFVSILGKQVWVQKSQVFILCKDVKVWNLQLFKKMRINEAVLTFTPSLVKLGLNRKRASSFAYEGDGQGCPVWCKCSNVQSRLSGNVLLLGKRCHVQRTLMFKCLPLYLYT